ncbi:hypothetical protein J7E71_17265 [Mesobacillus foraminis]|uniref:hypothetical protein n=1 Tax=Mesobacillus foraminis TaxID=279826 RepID=UPI001BED33C3|nr:hypothetical protein [Mesobacillus foraminis]MBT2757642.1 hypothetical protein [Mesobacillus foraminis]
MQIYSIFQQSIYMELAISQLKESGFSSIFAIPLEEFENHPKILDTIDRSDGHSYINKGMALAVVFSTIFASRGFEFRLGPIIWGLIGAVGGFILGLIIDLLLYKWKNKPLTRRKGRGNQVILVIECNRNERKYVTEILAENGALGFAAIEQDSQE